MVDLVSTAYNNNHTFDLAGTRNLILRIKIIFSLFGRTARKQICIFKNVGTAVVILLKNVVCLLSRSIWPLATAHSSMAEIQNSRRVSSSIETVILCFFFILFFLLVFTLLGVFGLRTYVNKLNSICGGPFRFFFFFFILSFFLVGPIDGSK